MNISVDSQFEIIAATALVGRVRALKREGWRLVQIGATRLAEEFEVTYSFDLGGHLANLRVFVPAGEPRLPSITPVYWGAFLYENELHDLFGLSSEGLAVDFHGHLYKTAVKFAFGTTKIPAANPPPAAPKPSLQNPASGITNPASRS